MGVTAGTEPNNLLATLRWNNLGRSRVIVETGVMGRADYDR